MCSKDTLPTFSYQQTQLAEQVAVRVTSMPQEMSLDGPAQIPVHSTGTGVLGATRCHIHTSDGHSAPVLLIIIFHSR